MKTVLTRRLRTEFGQRWERDGTLDPDARLTISVC